MADSREQNQPQMIKGKHAAIAADAYETGGAAEAGTMSRGKRALIIAAIVLCLLVAFCGIAYLAWNQMNVQQAASKTQDTATPSTQPVAPSTDQPQADLVPQNPIDFSSLKLENPDIYAWIYIPNTQVNYPIVQHPTDDFYYLTHDAEGHATSVGAIYTEMCNATDFSDPVTVVYGHNIADDLMFATLHYFENTDFFNENQTIYVYRPGHILTYTIVAAYQYDDRHIVNSFDFTNPATLQSYYESVLHPESLLVNERFGAQLTTSDKMIQLSTCMTNYSHTNTRYIVTGVLTDDQQTQ